MSMKWWTEERRREDPAGYAVAHHDHTYRSKRQVIQEAIDFVAKDLKAEIKNLEETIEGFGSHGLVMFTTDTVTESVLKCVICGHVRTDWELFSHDKDGCEKCFGPVVCLRSEFTDEEREILEEKGIKLDKEIEEFYKKADDKKFAEKDALIEKLKNALKPFARAYNSPHFPMIPPPRSTFRKAAILLEE